MLDALAAIVVVIVGAVATVALQRFLAERERRKVLLQRYLAQMQDACESLWYRLGNLAYYRAETVTDPDYLVTTTMYTLGRALGIERMLSLEGLYSEIWRRFPTLESVLERRVIDEAVQETTEGMTELQQYDRVALAEAVVERDGESFRPSTFLEFRRRMEGRERHWWQPARDSISGLVDSGDVVRLLREKLKEIATTLAPVTRMESPLAREPDPRTPLLSSEGQP